MRVIRALLISIPVLPLAALAVYVALHEPNAFTAIATAVIAAIASLVCANAARNLHIESEGVDGRLWPMLFAGFGTWAASRVVLGLAVLAPELPCRPVAAALYFAGCGLIAAAFLMLAVRAAPWRQPRQLIDAASIVLSAAAALFAALPALRDSGSAIEYWTAVAYIVPAGTGLVFAAACFALGARGPAASSRRIHGVLAGTLVVVASSVLFSGAHARDDIILTSISTAGWVAGSALVVIAITSFSARAAEPEPHGSRAANGAIQLFQLAFVVLLTSAVVAERVYTEFTVPVVPAALALAGFALIVLRLAMAARDFARVDADVEERVRRKTEGTEFLASIVEATTDFVATIDGSGRTVFLNRAARRMLAVEYERDPGEIQLAHSFPRWAMKALRGVAIPSAQIRGVWRGESALLAHGAEVPISLVVVAQRDDTGAQPLFTMIARDISEHKALEDRLTVLANHDGLTGLYNRRRFEELLRQLLETTLEAREPIALCVFDLDGFKFINDDLGHQVGDAVLQAVAKILRNLTGEDGLVGRIGGDEFAVVLHPATPESARDFAESLLAEIRLLRVTAGVHTIRATASIGIVMTPGDGVTVRELIARADIAMYGAKSRRDQAVFFSELGEGVDVFGSHRELETRIREALEDDRFTLFGQPVLHMPTGSMHYELLLRMFDTDGTLVSPAVFLPAAERSGLIHAVDRHVATLSFDLVQHMQSQGIMTAVAFNLSGRAFEDETLLRFLIDEAKKTKDPTRVIIEITETAAIENIDAAISFINALNNVGITFALDDFGVGYSSFHHLKRLPVKYLKIDGSFIRELRSDTTDQSLVRSLVELATGLGKKVVAEFVQDQETADMLASFGVEYVQGYGIGRPLPVEEQLLKKAA